MNLVWVTIHGYKRFETETKLNLEGKVIALVGPNEAGKSSILSAIRHLNSDGAFADTGVLRELTTDAEIPNDQEIIKAGYRLSDHDRETIKQSPGASAARWLYVTKYPDGKLGMEVFPSLHRDLTARRELAEFLSRFADEDLIEGLPADKFSLENIRDIKRAIASTVETLPIDVINELGVFEDLLAQMNSEKENDFADEASRLVEELIAKETSPHPQTVASEILANQRPKFLLFTDDERSLRHVYDLSGTEATPIALNNLAALADLDLGQLKDAISKGEVAKVETLIHAANEHLKTIFEESWTQSGVSVHLRLDDQILNVLVRFAKAAFTSIAERSDGLRHYVTLLAFVTHKGAATQRPILLIDEAEGHLHYDAQADLVQMLAKQEVVAKVIYTTHSVGCLPEDLGTGVRLIQPTPENNIRSEIKNWFWDSDDPGLSPLLFGMGATTLAFVPIRRALFAEGAADFILFPSLLRKAIGRSHLDFQTVPGLSSADKEQIPFLRNEATHVAFLVDADEGGKRIATKLRNAGIPEDKIIPLPDNDQLGLVLEDFVDPGVYQSAVLQVLSHRPGAQLEIRVSDVPDANRPAWLDNLCKNAGIKPPGRREVAYQILDLQHEAKIVYDRRQKELEGLYARIKTILQM
jgi:predicted ATP-dependent endonuclease of OLD family